MDDAAAGLIGVAIVLVALYFLVVYVVLPILGILAGIGVLILVAITGAGLVSGIFIGLKNFIEVFIEAHNRLP